MSVLHVGVVVDGRTVFASPLDSGGGGSRTAAARVLPRAGRIGGGSVMKPNPLHDQILDLWRQGKSNKQIAAKLHVGHGMVKHIIQEKRKELGPEQVPYAKDIANKSTRGKTIRISKTTQINDINKVEVSITWVGAFKALAYRLRDIGDEEGWKFAQEIARKKEVRL